MAVKTIPKKKPEEQQFNVFKFVQDINFDKNYLFDDSTQSVYNPWTINNAMTMFPDTLSHAVFLNSNASLDKKMQHDYLFYAVPKRKRFKKDGWFKKTDAEKRELKTLEDVSLVINYNMIKTKQFWNTLDKDQKAEFLERYVYPDSRNQKK